MDKSHVIAIMAAILYGERALHESSEDTVEKAYDLYDKVITASPEVRRVREVTRERL